MIMELRQEDTTAHRTFRLLLLNAQNGVHMIWSGMVWYGLVAYCHFSTFFYLPLCHDLNHVHLISSSSVHCPFWRIFCTFLAHVAARLFKHARIEGPEDRSRLRCRLVQPSLLVQPRRWVRAEPFLGVHLAVTLLLDCLHDALVCLRSI